MTAAFDAWVESARRIPIEHVTNGRGIKLRRVGVEREGPCPKCGGKDRFSINVKENVWNCRHCKPADITGDVIGFVQWLDNCDFMAAVEKLSRGPRPEAKPNGKGRAAGERKVVVAQFDYHDQDDVVVFAVERVEYFLPDGSPVLTEHGKRKKDFRQKRPDPDRPGDWIWNTKGVPALPYRLPELTEAVDNEYFIVIAEGEAKVDLLRSWNVPGTCCAGGAKKWRRGHSEFLRGADVILLPDNDAPGRKHVEAVAESLQGVAASIRVLDLPDLPVRGDVIDWAAAGGTAEQLHELIEREAKSWTPGAEESDEPRPPEFSDESLALGFAERHADDLRYVAFRSRWLFWERWRWKPDETLAAFDRVRALCREQAAACPAPRAATAIASARTVGAVERLSKADRRIAAAADQFDADSDFLNSKGDAHGD